MPRRKNNPSNAFVAKQGQSQDARPDNMNRMEIEPVPGDTGPGVVDATEPGAQGKYSDRIKYDEFGGVNKSTMRPKQKVQRT